MKLLKGKEAHVQLCVEKDIWKEFWNIFFNRGQLIPEALAEAIEIYNEKHNDFTPVNDEKELIKTTTRVIMQTWLNFKDLFKKRGQKKDPAITEAILLYIKKYKGEK